MDRSLEIFSRPQPKENARLYLLLEQNVYRKHSWVPLKAIPYELIGF